MTASEEASAGSETITDKDVFIIHIHQDRVIAQALRDILERLPQGQVKVGFIEGETMPYAEILKRIRAAKAVLAIITPEANRGNRVSHSVGFSKAVEKKVKLVVYFMKPDNIDRGKVYVDYESFIGDHKSGVETLCIDVMKTLDCKPLKKDDELLQFLISAYLEKVQEEAKGQYARSLFSDDFHTRDTAERLKGKWYAKWMRQYDDGTEEVYEVDSLSLWTTAERIRLVGDGAKEAKYPMEGVVSWKGYIALTYWSEGDIPICGTALMRPVGRLNILEGTWQGFSAPTLNEEPQFMQGRVVMAKDRKVAEERWGLLPPPSKAADAETSATA